MATKAYTVYADEIASYVKGANSAGNAAFITDQTLKVIRDFTKKTWIWREVLGKISVVDGTDKYTLTSGTDLSDVAGEVCTVDWVKYKEDGLADTQFAYLNPLNLASVEVSSYGGISAGYVEESADAPTDFYVDADDSLIIKPIPNAAAAGTENMQVKVILQPALTSTTAPDFLYYDWLETISIGVAARIMRMAALKWYNPELAEYYDKKYKGTRNDEARAQIWEGKNRNKQTVIFSRAFSGGNRQQGRVF